MALLWVLKRLRRHAVGEQMRRVEEALQEVTRRLDQLGRDVRTLPPSDYGEGFDDGIARAILIVTAVLVEHVSKA
jgi:hypothetical protein